MTQLALSFTAVQKTPRSTKMGLSYRQIGLQAAALRSSPHLGNEGSSLSLRASNGTSDSDTRHLAIGSATLNDEWQESTQDLGDWDLEKGLAVLTVDCFAVFKACCYPGPRAVFEYIC